MLRLRIWLIIFITFVLSSFPIQQFAYASDVQPPQLVEWQLQYPYNLDNRNVDVKSQVKFVITDETSIQVPILLVRNLNNPAVTYPATVEINKSFGGATEFIASVNFKRGTLGGNWQWELNPLRDSLGNQNNNLLLDNRPSVVNILNCDFTPYDSWNSRMSITNLKLSLTLDALNTELKKTTNNRALSLLLLKAPKPMNLSDVGIQLTKPTTCQDAFPTNINELTFNFSLNETDINDFVRNATLTIRDAEIERNQIEANNKAAAEKAAADKALADAAAKAAANKAKSQTITCIKGKLSKKVIGINPKCPAGYKKIKQLPSR